MVSTLDITASLPVDTVTVVNAASVSVFALQLQNAYRSHVDNTAYSGYGPDQHQTSHIAVPAAGIGIGTASSNAATDLQTFLQEITTQVANIVGGSPASWAAVSPPTSLTLINNAITGHTIVAASAASATTATTAGSFVSPQTYTSTIGDYKASPGSAAQITIAAGGSYEDSNFAIVTALGSQTANLPTQPTGTNTQYVGISLAPGTGAPSVTAAAVNAAKSTLILPTGYKPICVVLWRGATTLPSGIVAAGDIEDIRMGGGGGGGTGSGTGLSTADPVVTVGAISDDANETDIVALLGGYASGTVNGIDRATITGGKGTRSGQWDGSVADTWQLYVQPDVLSRLSLTAAATITLSAGANVNQNGVSSPIVLGSNGRLRTNTANVSASASGSAGPRYVIADLSATLSGTTTTEFTLVNPLPVSNTAGQYQILLDVVWYDGAGNIQPFGAQAVAGDSPLVGITSNQVTAIRLSYVASGTDTITNTGGVNPVYARPTNFPLNTFYLPSAMQAFVLSRARIDVSLAAATDYTESFVRFDAGLSNPPQQAVCDMGVVAPASATFPYRKQDFLTSFDEMTLIAGPHTVSQDWIATTGATGTIYVTRKVLILLFHI